MRYLGLDLGTKTLGLACSDPMGIIASNLKTLRHEEDYDSLIPLLKEIIEEKKIDQLVLGLPKNMNNSIGSRAEIALEFKKKLEDNLNIIVNMQDERMTTRQAENILISNDTTRKKRKQVIDSMAATIILQSFLDRKGN
ncbi:MAG: Holliday junction resolvase RuvX [Bacilli bacterium]|nr:Holliday junction resolvase RuvX [Bacilli bacterium]